MRIRRLKKGFTLAELLIVVAIIAVLVAIAVPVFSGNLERAKEATCSSNRRSLYGQVVYEHLLTDRPYSDIFAEFVGGAGTCPSGGAFSWEDSGETGIVHCDYHDSGSGSGGGSGSGSGGSSGSGSGSGPVLHGQANLNETTINKGSVIQDETGTCIITTFLWPVWTSYSAGTKAAQLAELYPSLVTMVDPSNIKDSSTETLNAGDLYYVSETNAFYYVTGVNQYESRPNGGWIPLLQ
jgi:prepilin-type N-terminal cleavage/methylation domain-containing protein